MVGVSVFRRRRLDLILGLLEVEIASESPPRTGTLHCKRPGPSFGEGLANWITCKDITWV